MPWSSKLFPEKGDIPKELLDLKVTSIDNDSGAIKRKLPDEDGKDQQNDNRASKRPRTGNSSTNEELVVDEYEKVAKPTLIGEQSLISDDDLKVLLQEPTLLNVRLLLDKAISTRDLATYNHVAILKEPRLAMRYSALAELFVSNQDVKEIIEQQDDAQKKRAMYVRLVDLIGRAVSQLHGVRINIASLLAEMLVFLPKQNHETSAIYAVLQFVIFSALSPMQGDSSRDIAQLSYASEEFVKASQYNRLVEWVLRPIAAIAKSGQSNRLHARFAEVASWAIYSLITGKQPAVNFTTIVTQGELADFNVRFLKCTYVHLRDVYAILEMHGHSELDKYYVYFFTQHPDELAGKDGSQHALNVEREFVQTTVHILKQTKSEHIVLPLLTYAYNLQGPNWGGTVRTALLDLRVKVDRRIKKRSEYISDFREFLEKQLRDQQLRGGQPSSRLIWDVQFDCTLSERRAAASVYEDYENAFITLRDESVSNAAKRDISEDTRRKVASLRKNYILGVNETSSSYDRFVLIEDSISRSSAVQRESYIPLREQARIQWSGDFPTAIPRKELVFSEIHPVTIDKHARGSASIATSSDDLVRVFDPTGYPTGQPVLDIRSGQGFLPEESRHLLTKYEAIRANTAAWFPMLRWAINHGTVGKTILSVGSSYVRLQDFVERDLSDAFYVIKITRGSKKSRVQTSLGDLIVDELHWDVPVARPTTGVRRDQLYGSRKDGLLRALFDAKCFYDFEALFKGYPQIARALDYKPNDITILHSQEKEFLDYLIRVYSQRPEYYNTEVYNIIGAMYSRFVPVNTLKQLRIPNLSLVPNVSTDLIHSQKLEFIPDPTNIFFFEAILNNNPMVLQIALRNLQKECHIIKKFRMDASRANDAYLTSVAAFTNNLLVFQLLASSIRASLKASPRLLQAEYDRLVADAMVTAAWAGSPGILLYILRSMLPLVKTDLYKAWFAAIHAAVCGLSHRCFRILCDHKGFQRALVQRLRSVKKASEISNEELMPIHTILLVLHELSSDLNKQMDLTLALTRRAPYKLQNAMLKDGDRAWERSRLIDMLSSETMLSIALAMSTKEPDTSRERFRCITYNRVVCTLMEHLATQQVVPDVFVRAMKSLDGITTHMTSVRQPTQALSNDLHEKIAVGALTRRIAASQNANAVAVRQKPTDSQSILNYLYADVGNVPIAFRSSDFVPNYIRHTHLLCAFYDVDFQPGTDKGTWRLIMPGNAYLDDILQSIFKYDTEALKRMDLENRETEVDLDGSILHDKIFHARPQMVLAQAYRSICLGRESSMAPDAFVRVVNKAVPPTRSEPSVIIQKSEQDVKADVLQQILALPIMPRIR